jgi:hypothetical protein
VSLFTFDELTTPLSRQEVQQSIYNVLGTLGVDTTTWKPGAVVRSLIVGVSVVLSGLSQLTVQIARSGFLELSEGDWLTLVAHHVYGVERIQATFATGQITLVNAGGGIYSEAADDLIVSSPSTGKQFRNTAPFSLGAFATLTIPIRATEIGADSTALPATITNLVTSLLGVSCSNALSLVGLNAELDPSLRTRCSEKLGALSPNGPWDAYGFAVRNATRPDGSNVGVTRIRITKDGFGNVFVYCANATGAITDAGDLAILDTAIQTLAAPLAVTAHLLSATNVVVPITYELWMYNTSGRSVSQVTDAVAARLLAFFEAQPIGGNVVDPDPGKVFVDAVRAAIISTLPEIFHAVVTLPAADLSLAINEVPTLGAITVTAVHQVPPSEGQA